MSCQALSGDSFCLLYMTACASSVNYVSRGELCKLLTLLVPIVVVVVVVRAPEQPSENQGAGYERWFH